jgi:hypothetical protein
VQLSRRGRAVGNFARPENAVVEPDITIAIILRFPPATVAWGPIDQGAKLPQDGFATGLPLGKRPGIGYPVHGGPRSAMTIPLVKTWSPGS